MYIFGKINTAILKNPDLRQFQKLHHWKAFMPKHNPRSQNQPPRHNSFEVFGPKSGHFEKSRPLTVSKITSLES